MRVSTVVLAVVVAVVAAAASASIVYFAWGPEGMGAPAPKCKVSEVAGTTWKIVYVNVSSSSTSPLVLREGTYTYRVIPASREYYDELVFTIKRINSTCYNVTKVSRTYIIEGNKTEALTPSYSYYLVFNSGKAIFVRSWSPSVGTKYFNLELWPTSDNVGIITVVPLFLPYIELGSNCTISAKVNIYLPNQFIEYEGTELLSVEPTLTKCSGPGGACYVVNSRLNVTMKIYGYEGGRKGSLIDVRVDAYRFRYLIDESGVPVLIEKFIGENTLLSRTELTAWK